MTIFFYLLKTNAGINPIMNKTKPIMRNTPGFSKDFIIFHSSETMDRNPKFMQYDGPLPKEATEFSCSYKTVEEAKKAIMREVSG